MEFQTLTQLAIYLLTEYQILLFLPDGLVLLLYQQQKQCIVAYGGPLAHTNKYLKKHPTDEKIAIGGIMNAKNLAPLRIDTTQHQMHAVMMALETLFANE